MFLAKRKFCGQISLGNTGPREAASPSGRKQAEFPYDHRPLFLHCKLRVSETHCRAQSISMMCSRHFRNITLVALCGSNWRRVGRGLEGGAA